MNKNKITKYSTPEGFSVSMAIIDLIPVLFFGLSSVKVGLIFQSRLFIFGSLICLISGIIKVLWKLLAALLKKNKWWMFVQMRILMPIGFLTIIAALFINRAKLSLSVIISILTGFPSCIFFIIGAIGMITMLIFAFILDSSDPKVNWAEQTVNSVAQISFFIGLTLI